MKYFIDTEFIERFHKALFGKARHVIDLISIGIYCEDGRTYSAISNEYSYSDADKWVKENVLLPLYISTVHGDARNNCDTNNFHKYFGKSNRQIAKEIEAFVNPHVNYRGGNYFNNFLYSDEYHKLHNTKEFALQDTGLVYWRNEPEFYGYYSDYDWVVFCSMFGRMIDLPKGFPMYCKDLKQMLDDKANADIMKVEDKFAGESRFETSLRLLKNNPCYPKQENEHNALADAKWNYELYKFLQTK